MRLWIAALLLAGCCAANAQPLPNARLGLSPNLHWVGDLTAQATLYYTNDQVVYSDPGPWSPNSLYDEFFTGSEICHQNWTPRPTSGPVPPPAPTTCTGTYIGSASTDANGQFNQHKTAGPTRRWDVWNAIPSAQKLIDLQVVDATGNLAPITTSQGNWHPITSNSFATFIIGLPEDANCLYFQQVYPLSSGAAGNAAWGVNACGWGSQFANPVPWTWPSLIGMPQGYYGQVGSDIFSPDQLAPGGNDIADYTSVDNVGVQTVWSVYIASSVSGAGASVTFFGKNVAHRMMHIRYPG